MKCLDDIFYDDFRIMMRQLKVMNGQKSVVPLLDAQGKVIHDDFPVPEVFLKDTHIIKTVLPPVRRHHSSLCCRPSASGPLLS